MLLAAAKTAVYSPSATATIIAEPMQHPRALAVVGIAILNALAGSIPSLAGC
jgi:hypothetical protein